MSNDLILSIKNSLAHIDGGVDAETRAVAGGGSGGSKRISIKGGVFRKVVGGKEVGAIEDRHMNVIFVKMNPTPSRTFYSQGYREGEKISPICWSTNSTTPDVEVKNPQGVSCDKCMHSVKGSGQGGNGSACRLSWRTAVVLPNDVSGDVMQLVLPATSSFGKEENGRWPFRPYIQMLAANSISANHVVTRMQFDTAYPVPRVIFSAVAPVSAEDIETVKAQGSTSFAINAVKLTVFHRDEGDAPAQPRAPVQRTPVVVEEIEEEVEAAEQPTPEPVKRDSKKDATAPAATDVPDIISKWSKR
jgi:hypothetical protein